MAINFPNNPAVSDTFTVSGTTFTFTGVKWESGAVVELSSDTTPILGGDLDGSANNINNVGIITAITFSGNVTGNADTATTATYAETAGISTYATTAGISTYATTAGVSTNAQGLTGDPSIQVTNATVLGNLDVQGTTTTIDTAITEVDSLNVEGSVGIGTDNPARVLHTSGDLVRFDNDGPAAVILVDHNDNKNFRIVTNISNSHSFSIEDMGASVSGAGTARLTIDGSGTLYSYSPDDTTPNFKFRSDDTNWHGALNQSVHGGTITSFLSCGGDWDADGTTYNCTKNLAAYPSSAIAVHNQYNNSFESKFVFLTKAGGSTTTDGGVTELASISSAGTISDSIGPLRRLGINNHNAATYTLVAGDAGKLVREATNSANITIPQNVFAAGDMISIFNVSGGNNTITQGSGVTLYNTADGATGNRTLAAKGVCTIACTSTNEFIISGSGLS